MLEVKCVLLIDAASPVTPATLPEFDDWVTLPKRGRLTAARAPALIVASGSADWASPALRSAGGVVPGSAGGFVPGLPPPPPQAVSKIQVTATVADLNIFMTISFVDLLNRVDDLQKPEEAGDKKDNGDPGLRNWIIDSSTIRAHRRAAGPFRDGEPQEIRHSRGGRTTKIHAAVNGKAGLRRMRLSPGQAADRAEAAVFLDGLEASCVLIADKAYDADAVLKRAVEVSCRAVIPSEPNRRRQRPLDAAAYAKRNVIERFFGRITEFRQVATRFNKRTHNFAAVILTGVSRLLRYDAKRTAGYAA